MPLWAQLALLIGAIVVLPVLLRLYADDEPRNHQDEPPDTSGGDDRDGQDPDVLIAA